MRDLEEQENNFSVTKLKPYFPLHYSSLVLDVLIKALETMKFLTSQILILQLLKYTFPSLHIFSVNFLVILFLSTATTLELLYLAEDSKSPRASRIYTRHDFHSTHFFFSNGRRNHDQRWKNLWKCYFGIYLYSYFHVPYLLTFPFCFIC